MFLPQKASLENFFGHLSIIQITVLIKASAMSNVYRGPWFFFVPVKYLAETYGMHADHHASLDMRALA